jgi:hypothetical protein
MKNVVIASVLLLVFVAPKSILKFHHETTQLRAAWQGASADGLPIPVPVPPAGLTGVS